MGTIILLYIQQWYTYFITYLPYIENILNCRLYKHCPEPGLNLQPTAVAIADGPLLATPQKSTNKVPYLNSKCEY